jgi:SAM-dependent methyltransferase
MGTEEAVEKLKGKFTENMKEQEKATYMKHRGPWDYAEDLLPPGKKSILEFKGKTILDVGCGKFQFSKFWDVPKENLPKQIVGIDILPKPSSIGANAKYIQSKIESLSSAVEKNSFDMVLAHTVLDYVANSKEAVQNMLRALKPEGVLYVRSMTPLAYFEDVGGEERIRPLTALLQELGRFGFDFRMYPDEIKRFLGHPENHFGITKPSLEKMREILQSHNIQVGPKEQEHIIAHKFNTLVRKKFFGNIVFQDFLSTRKRWIRSNGKEEWWEGSGKLNRAAYPKYKVKLR